MKISIQSNLNAIKESLRITDELLGDLKVGGYFYYFPFLNNISETSNTAIERQIIIDLNEKIFHEKAKRFEDKWNKISSEILLIFENYIKNRNAQNIEEYFCNLTVYGPYGYYNSPNVVLVNIGTDKNIDFSIETLIHELLHLIMETDKFFSNKKHYDKEKDVDLVFIELFGKYFPDYYKQDFDN